MSDTIKLIIEIPKAEYERAKQRWMITNDVLKREYYKPQWMKENDAHKMDYYISIGTPLDDLRADLHATAEMHSDGDYYLRDEWIDEYFDDIGKAESEDKE